MESTRLRALLGALIVAPPDKCTSVTSVADKDGEFGAGCVKCTLPGDQLTFSDPRWTGTFRDGKLEMREAEEAFKTLELAAPRVGSTLNVSLMNIDRVGACLPGSFCSITKTYLTLQTDGTFGLPGVSFTAVGAYPPANRGRYTILPGFRVQLDYESGTRKILPLALVKGVSRIDTATQLLFGQFAYWPKDEDD